MARKKPMNSRIIFIRHKNQPEVVLYIGKNGVLLRNQENASSNRPRSPNQTGVLLERYPPVPAVLADLNLNDLPKANITQVNKDLDPNDQPEYFQIPQDDEITFCPINQDQLEILNYCTDPSSNYTSSLDVYDLSSPQVNSRIDIMD